MATIDIRHTHKTDLDDAKARTKGLLDDFAAKRSDIVKSVSWTPDGRTATAKGKGFSGTFQVTDRELVVAIDLKLLARPFKGQVEDALKRHIEETFGA